MNSRFHLKSAAYLSKDWGPPLIVAAFIRSGHVSRLWWNKGPDGTHVYLKLRNEDILSQARSLGSDAIAIFHNHPNPYGNSATREPSPNDISSALTAARVLLSREISLLEFICDRGVPYLYFTAFSEAEETLEPIIKDIRSKNGPDNAENYRLRKELRPEFGEESLAGFGLYHSGQRQLLAFADVEEQSLAEFDRCHPAEKGAWLQVVHPETGEEMGVAEGVPCRILLKGQKSHICKSCMEKSTAMDGTSEYALLEEPSNRSILKTAQLQAETQAALLAMMTMGWENLEYGEDEEGKPIPLEFNKENALKLYLEQPWIRSQALQFTEDNANFPELG